MKKRKVAVGLSGAPWGSLGAVRGLPNQAHGPPGLGTRGPLGTAFSFFFHLSFHFSKKRETSRGDEHVVAREALEGALSRSLGVRAHEPRPSSAEHVRELVAEVVRALAQIRKLVDVV